MLWPICTFYQMGTLRFVGFKERLKSLSDTSLNWHDSSHCEKSTVPTWNTRLLGWLVFFSLVYFNFVFFAQVLNLSWRTHFCTLKKSIFPKFFLKNKNKTRYLVATSQLLFQLGCFKVQVSLIWKSLGFHYSPYNYIQKMEVCLHKSACPKREKNLQPVIP